MEMSIPTKKMRMTPSVEHQEEYKMGVQREEV